MCPRILAAGSCAAELRGIAFFSTNPSHLYQLQEWADLQVGGLKA